jgi:hypothetical protein
MTISACDRAREAMSDYLAGDVLPDELAALEAHVAECAACGAEIDRVILQDRALGELVGISLAESLKGRVRSGLAKVQAARRLRLRRILFVAATILVAVGASAVWMQLPSGEVPAIATLDVARGEVLLTTKSAASPAARGMPVAEGQGLQTRGAESRAVLRYPDGSEFELRGDTTLRGSGPSWPGGRCGPPWCRSRPAGRWS